MKNCPDCGAELDDNMSVCEWCGYSFEKAIAEFPEEDMTGYESYEEEDLYEPESDTAISSQALPDSSEVKPYALKRKKINTTSVLVAIIVVLSIIVCILAIQQIFPPQKQNPSLTENEAVYKQSEEENTDASYTSDNNAETEADSTTETSKETSAETSPAAAAETTTSTELATVTELTTTTEFITEVPAEPETEQIVSNTKEWENAYLAKIMQYAGEYDMMYSVYDIDCNGIPELFISMGIYHAAGVEIYTYYDNSCHQVTCYNNGYEQTEFGVYGEAGVNSNYNMVFCSDMHMDYTWAAYYEFDGRQLTKVMDYGYSDYMPDSGLENTFTVNGVDTTKAALDEAAAPYRAIADELDCVVYPGRDFQCTDPWGVQNYT